LDLTFANEELATVCNQRNRLASWAGSEACALEQLLNEIECADRLGMLEELPHVLLRRAAQGRIGAHGDEMACVLLRPDAQIESYRDAEAAIVVAVAVGAEELNPEGAAWPRAFAMSPTTR
jgi:hypothetical protein